MSRPIIALCLAFLLSACASILQGNLQDVTLTTPGAPGSRCIVRNHYFLYVINPPRRFQIERTDEP